MIKNTISYTDQNDHLEGFVAYSDHQKKQPLVILCHAWAGRDAFICEKAELVANWGFVGFALDMYGKGILGKSKEENAALKKPFMEDRQLLQRRVLKGFETACSLPYVDSTKVAVLGFGFGGVCALDLARSGAGLKGVISVYGHYDTPKKVAIQPIKSKILILHGYNDPVSPLEELLTFQKEMDRDKVDWQTHLFGNTVHAFTNPLANDAASGIKYHAESAQSAWQAIENFLKKI